MSNALKRLRHRRTVCPYCETPSNASAALNVAAVERRAGDASICGMCANIAVIAPDGRTLLKALTTDLARFQADPKGWEAIQRAQSIVRAGKLKDSLETPPIMLD